MLCLRAFILVALVQLAGCFGPRLEVPDVPGVKKSEPPEGGGGVLMAVADGLFSFGGWIMALGIIATVASFFIAALKPFQRYTGAAAGVGFTCIVAASVVKWISCNYWVVMLFILVGGTAYTFIHLRLADKIEKRWGVDITPWNGKDAGKRDPSKVDTERIEDG